MEKLDVLKVNHYWNLDLPYGSNIEQQTNNLVACVMNSLRQKALQVPEATFVFYYDYSTESILTFHMMKSLFGLLPQELKVYYAPPRMKNKKIALESIGYHHLKHNHNQILITPYHPIFNPNVAKQEKSFFAEVYCPIENFTGLELNVLYDWYIHKESPEYNENDKSKYELKKIIDLPDYKGEKFVYNIYHMTNSNESIKLVDVIRKNNEDKNAINIYIIDGSGDKVLQYFNNFFDYKHRISDYSIFNTDQKDVDVLENLYRNEDVKYYCYKDYKEE